MHTITEPATESCRLSPVASSVGSGKDSELQSLIALLPKSEVLTPGDEAYENESKTWSSGRNLHPKIVVRPQTTKTLSDVLKFLGNSSLDFNIRNSGAGNASAKDVLISTRAFTDFEFDRENEIVTIGAGNIWSEYYKKMKEVTTEYSVVSIVTPFIGVGGSTISAGFSAMSREFGCVSDPENLLDAEIVKLDGSISWASEDPDLLWGLRGGYIGLGVVTKLKLRAVKYDQTNAWGGSIIIPRNKDQELAEAITAIDRTHYVNRRVFALLLLMPDCFILNAYDALSEQHFRETFALALNIEGAVDTTRPMDLEGFSGLQSPAEFMKGTSRVWFNPMALGQLDNDFVLKAFGWQDRMAAEGNQAGVMFELWGTRGPTSGPTGSVWPRPEYTRHFCMLSMMVDSSAPPEVVEKARGLIEQAPRELLEDKYDESKVATSGLDEFHNVRPIYQSNWERILKVKQKYDPKGRFNGSLLAKACIEDIKKLRV